jgi:hypothetical protein
VQHEAYIRSNNNKEQIKHADFPAEAPESNSHKYEAGNAEHSVHDLSSECSKESSLTKISESCDHTKNNGGTNQAEKHKAHEVFVVPLKGKQAWCQVATILNYSCKYLFSADFNLHNDKTPLRRSAPDRKSF